MAGPVGTGKSSLIALLCRELGTELSLAVVTNDIYTDEDARFLRSAGVLDPERIRAVETGACPHTAIRDDISQNLLAVEDLERDFAPVDVVLVESGGDNLTATFSPALVDAQFFVLDVAGGGDVARKGGPGIARADALVVNKTDLAPYVGVDVEQMVADAEHARDGRTVLPLSRQDPASVARVKAWVLATLAEFRTGSHVAQDPGPWPRTSTPRPARRTATPSRRDAQPRARPFPLRPRRPRRSRSTGSTGVTSSGCARVCSGRRSSGPPRTAAGSGCWRRPRCCWAVTSSSSRSGSDPARGSTCSTWPGRWPTTGAASRAPGTSGSSWPRGRALTYAGEPFVVGDGADVTRTLDVDLAPDASAVVRDTVVLGRTGQRGGRLRSVTAVRVGGRPVLLEDQRLDPDGLRERARHARRPPRPRHGHRGSGRRRPAPTAATTYALVGGAGTLSRWLGTSLADSPLHRVDVGGRATTSNAP